METEGLSLTAEWTINDMLTFKSITARRDGYTDTVIDFDGTPSPTLDIPAYYADDQFTQEFQLLFNGARWQGVAGVYYLDSHAEGAFDTVLGNLGVSIGTGGFVDTESYAVFADFNFDLSDRLRVAVGARYTEDDKTGFVNRATYLGAGQTPLTGGPAATPLVQNTLYTNSRSFSEFTPRISVSYDLNDDLTGYAAFSQGFKSGGFDMRGDALATPDTVDGYDPETVDSYELGLKGYAFDRRLTFSSALFYSDYQDQQVTTQVPTATGIASFVDNVGASTIYGAEFEGSLWLTDFLTANFAVGYLRAEFEEFIRYNLTTMQYEDISDLVVVQNSRAGAATWASPGRTTCWTATGDHPVGVLPRRFQPVRVPQPDPGPGGLRPGGPVGGVDHAGPALAARPARQEPDRRGVPHGRLQLPGRAVRQLHQRLLRPAAHLDRSAADALLIV